MFAIHLFYELTIHMPCECPLQSKDINPLHVSTLQRMSFHDLHFIDASSFLSSLPCKSLKRFLSSLVGCIYDFPNHILKPYILKELSI